MSTDRRSQDTKTYNAQTIVQYVDLLAELPAPPTNFYAADVPDACMGTFQALVQDGVIEKVERETYPDADSARWRWRFRVSDRLHELAVEFRETEQTPCPCGHRGIRNRGDYYECRFEPCDREFDRAEIDEGAIA
jgi:hypothetical protein